MTPRPVELARGRIEPGVEALLDPAIPTRPRALAVLDGVLAGRVWVGDATHPRWVVAIEVADGTVYVGGEPGGDMLRALLAGVDTASGDLIFGFAGPNDPVRRMVPTDPYYEGAAIDFFDRVADPVGRDRHRLPAGLRLAPIDASLLPATHWYEDTLVASGSARAWQERSVGWCVLDGDSVVSQAMAGPRSRGLLEMGVWTAEGLRGRGLGTLMSQLVAETCEAADDVVWWNTSADNTASIAIARRLGFATERRYDLVAFRTAAFGR